MTEGTTNTEPVQIDYTEQFNQLILNTESLKLIEESNAANKTKLEEIHTILEEIKTDLQADDQVSPTAQEIVLSPQQIEELKTVALSEEQIQRLNTKYEKELNETVAVYFSIVLGLALAYVALKGLFTHWRST